MKTNDNFRIRIIKKACFCFLAPKIVLTNVWLVGFYGISTFVGFFNAKSIFNK